MQSAISAASFRHSLVWKGDSERLPGFPHGQTLAAPRLQWCEYGYGSASKFEDPTRWGILANPAAQPFRRRSVYPWRELAGRLRTPHLIVRKHPEENGPGMSLRMSPPRPTCPVGGPSHPWWEDGQHRSAWGRLAPDSQRRGQGLGDDCGNLSARMPSAGSIPGRRWASLRPSKPAILLGGGRHVLGVPRETFFENGLFQSGLLQEFESKCRKTVCAAISRWPQRC